MLKRKALRKILVTTFAVFTLFVVYLISDPTAIKELKTDIDVSYVSSLGMDDVYLLSTNNYLVKANTLLEASNVEGKVMVLLDYLTQKENNNLPVGLIGILPEDTKVYNILVDGDIITLNLSKEVWNGEQTLQERLIEGLTYSVVSLDGISGLKLQVEGIPVTEIPSSKKMLPEVLTKDFGINKVYDMDSSSGIQKVTTYYLNKVQEEIYFVPVTKYLNDPREKIDIIVENLSSSFLYEPTLISLVQDDVELMNYQIEDELMHLNFNYNLFSNEKMLEEVTYQIAYSVFDTYDVRTVLIEVDGEEFTRVEK